ncbi:MAG: GGDEF domain-containing protein [Rhodobacteraceae bacterium]|nr:GGDEF domain-containing protein [Paracoccaceae bacterium]
MLAKLVKSVLICMPCVLGAYFLLMFIEYLTGTPPTVTGTITAILIPVIIGIPVLFVIEGQAERLSFAVLQLDDMRLEAEDRAKRDSMTGLYNHQHFMDEIRASEGDRHKGSLLVLDIDKFKNINDSFGHQKGDEALISVVKAVRASVRGNDIIGRIGGEEFAVYLQDASKSEARIVANRIRENVEAIMFEPKKGLLAALTVSIGVAMKREVGNMVHALRLADMRMYEAKNTGRNRVVHSGSNAELDRAKTDTPA